MALSALAWLIGHKLDSMVLEVFFNLKDSGILFYYSRQCQISESVLVEEPLQVGVPRGHCRVPRQRAPTLGLFPSSRPG